MGVTDSNRQPPLNLVYSVSGWIPAIIGARLHDFIGRRKVLMGAAMGMAICLTIPAVTAADFVQSGDQQVSIASIAFIHIFGSVLALASTSMQPVNPCRVRSSDMSANGMGVLQTTAGCAGLINTFAAPVALDKVRIDSQTP